MRWIPQDFFILPPFLPVTITSVVNYVRRSTLFSTSKHDPLVVQAELLEANPQYAFVRLDSGHETTVSLRDVIM